MAITITSTVDRETRNPGSETSVLLGIRGATPSSAACWVPEIPHRLFSRILAVERSPATTAMRAGPGRDRGIRRRDEAALIVPQPGRAPAASTLPRPAEPAAPRHPSPSPGGPRPAPPSAAGSAPEGGAGGRLGRRGPAPQLGGVDAHQGAIQLSQQVLGLGEPLPLEPGAVAELDGDDVAGVPVAGAQEGLAPRRAAHHPG